MSNNNFILAYLYLRKSCDVPIGCVLYNFDTGEIKEADYDSRHALLDLHDRVGERYHIRLESAFLGEGTIKQIGNRYYLS
jgi:hypothetical protein